MKESLEATLKDVELTKEVYRLYTLEHLTQQEISVKLCIGRSTVWRKIRTFEAENPVKPQVPLCPSVGLLVPVTRASAAHQVGIDSPWAGQPLPITRATSAQTSDLFLGNILLILCDI